MKGWRQQGANRSRSSPKAGRPGRPVGEALQTSGKVGNVLQGLPPSSRRPRPRRAPRRLSGQAEYRHCLNQLLRLLAQAFGSGCTLFHQ